MGDDITRIGGGHVLLGDFISGHSSLQPINAREAAHNAACQISRRQQQAQDQKSGSDILLCDFEN